MSDTLEKLVENEKGEKKRTATEGLMWLLRGHSFTCKGLQNLQANPTEEVAAGFGKAYEVTLKPFHNFVVKGVFSVSPLFSPSSLPAELFLKVAMKACPYRADFLTS
jgi:hypothetical protein